MEPPIPPFSLFNTESYIRAVPAVQTIFAEGQPGDHMYAVIEGELNPSNPGSVVDGSTTWEMRFPEGFTMTITWHLEHSSPIVLPHA